MSRNTVGARVRFTDAFLEATGKPPIFGYEWGEIISVQGKSAEVRWFSDGVKTTVSDRRNLTTRKTGKFAVPGWR